MTKEMKSYLKYELQSFLKTFLAVFAVDGIIELMAIYNGDLTITALHSLIIAIARSILKAAWQLVFPNIFKSNK